MPAGDWPFVSDKDFDCLGSKLSCPRERFLLPQGETLIASGPEAERGILQGNDFLSRTKVLPQVKVGAPNGIFLYQVAGDPLSFSVGSKHMHPRHAYGPPLGTCKWSGISWRSSIRAHRADLIITTKTL